MPEGASVAALDLRDFRNFSRLRCELPPDGVVIVGPNGSGKTNLLEAIYYLEIFRSFRGAGDRELVRFGQDVFRIEATVLGPRGRRELAAAFAAPDGRKKAEVNGMEVERLGDAIGALGAVVFSLEDVEIVRGPPGRRRRFLDILLSLIEPGYLAALQRYRSVLGQRNRALKEQTPASLVDAWTNGLVEAGARIMTARARWVAGRADGFARYHAAVSGGSGAGIAYEPSVGSPGDEPMLDGAHAPAEGVGSAAGGTPAEGGHAPAAERDSPAGANADVWADRFRRALVATADRERRRGVTVAGPHRDELGFRATLGPGGEWRDLRTFGSGGQQRTAAIALRLVEADSLAERHEREPVYLLDDVFAELDRDRSERVVRLLDEKRSGQVVLAAPKPGDVPLRGGGLEVWSLRDGKLAA